MLPDKRDENPVEEDDFALRVLGRGFTLHLEKTTLACSLLRDSTGLRIISLDSTNSIFYSGNVENVKFDFIIEDQTLRRKLVLSTEDKTASRFFRIEERPDQQAALFFWKPPLNERLNHSYLVHVTATGKLPADSARGIFEDRIIQDKTKFSLNVITLNEQNYPLILADSLLAGDSLRADTLSGMDREALINELIAGDITLKPRALSIKAYAYENWTNQIFVLGANPRRDIRRPEIDLTLFPRDKNNGGTASIIGIDDYSIIIGGKAPFFGSMRIKLTVTRKYDDKIFSTDFTVYPKPIGRPDFEPVMYPGIKYKINPNLTPISDREISVVLKDGQNRRAISRDGSVIEFTPGQDDTGKNLYLLRYIDEKLIDEYIIQVNDFPGPEIIRISKVRDKSVRVETRSYGVYKGLENFVELDVVSGNAKVLEKLGHEQKDAAEMKWVQYFEITPKRSGRPFSFKIRAVDRRDRKSPTKSYEE